MCRLSLTAFLMFRIKNKRKLDNLCLVTENFALKYQLTDKIVEDTLYYLAWCSHSHIATHLVHRHFEAIGRP